MTSKTFGLDFVMREWTNKTVSIIKVKEQGFASIVASNEVYTFMLLLIISVFQACQHF